MWWLGECLLWCVLKNNENFNRKCASAQSVAPVTRRA
jgi:hypothetical protein